MKYLVTLDITVEATSRNDAFEKVEKVLGSQTFCLYDAEAVEQCVQSDLGGTSAQEVSPNEKDTGEGWGPQGNRPSR